MRIPMIWTDRFGHRWRLIVSDAWRWVRVA
jgi:hypothetical protein